MSTENNNPQLSAGEKLAALEADHLQALQRIEDLEKENADLKMKLPSPTEQASVPSFKYKGEEFEVIVPKSHIPGVGVRTAMEICHDEKAQKVLVDTKGNLGTVLRKK